MKCVFNELFSRWTHRRKNKIVIESYYNFFHLFFFFIEDTTASLSDNIDSTDDLVPSLQVIYFCINLTFDYFNSCIQIAS